MKSITKRILMIAMMTSVIFSSMGLNQAIAQTSTTHVKRNLATIMFAGLGGAVLGASTLSFYSSPSDHTGNIWLGLGIGLIAGSGYVVYREMQAPSVDYGKIQWPTNPSQRISAQNHIDLYNYKFEF